jgi:glutathione S-transferase
LQRVLHGQGYGRHSENEIFDIAKRDLTALSTLLGDKPYFFGTIPSTLDATAFGLLAQIIDTPLYKTDIKEFIEKSTPNLLNLVERIKRDYWPDWEILCKNLVMNASEVQDKH